MNITEIWKVINIMSHQFVFFDRSQEVVDAIGSLSLPNVTSKVADCREIVNSSELDAVVSPGNGAGILNGNIDQIYSSEFPQMNRLLQVSIAAHGIYDPIQQRFVLPPGSAVVVQTGKDTCKRLIFTPTSYFGGAIPPENVYVAFRGILKSIEGMPNMTIGICGLGTGYGGLSPSKFAQMIQRAMTDYNANIPSPYDATQTIIKNTPGCYVIG